MAFRFNPFTGTLDNIRSLESLDSRFVNVDGDTMTGDLRFPETGFLMNDGTNLWRVTVNTSGALVTTLAGTENAGSPMGLLLTLTYS